LRSASVDEAICGRCKLRECRCPRAGRPRQAPGWLPSAHSPHSSKRYRKARHTKCVVSGGQSALRCPIELQQIKRVRMHGRCVDEYDLPQPLFRVLKDPKRGTTKKIPDNSSTSKRSSNIPSGTEKLTTPGLGAHALPIRIFWPGVNSRSCPDWRVERLIREARSMNRRRNGDEDNSRGQEGFHGFRGVNKTANCGARRLPPVCLSYSSLRRLSLHAVARGLTRRCRPASSPQGASTRAS